MKQIFLIPVLTFLYIQTWAQQPASTTNKKLNVAIFIYPGIGLGDLNGPTDVFIKASGLTNGQYKVYTVALQSGTVVTQNGGLKLTPDYVADQMPQPDILIIPGASIGLTDSMSLDPKVIGFIKKYQEHAATTMSVCTGSYLLGKAGLLDHHKATTHYFLADDFQSQFPEMTVVRDVRFVDEGKIITTSGVTSGMDGALHLVAKYSGDKIAAMLARAIQYVPHEQEKWPVAPNGMKFDRNWHKKNGLLKQ